MIRRFAAQGFAATIGVLTVRLVTEVYPPSALGAVTSISLAVNLMTGALTLPPLQLALRSHFQRGDESSQAVVGQFSWTERRAAAGGLAALGAAYLAFPQWHAFITSVLLGFLGQRGWSIFKTELNAQRRDTLYQVVSIAPQVIPAAGSAALVMLVGLGEPEAVRSYFYLLGASGVVAGLVVNRNIPKHWDRKYIRATVLESATFAPTSMASWLMASAPRLFLLASAGRSAMAQLSAVWAPINQGFLTLGSVLLVYFRPRLYSMEPETVGSSRAFKTYLSSTVIACSVVGVSVTLTAPIWQQLVLAAEYRVPTHLIALAVVANVCVVCAQPLEQVLFVHRRQYLVWLPQLILVPLALGFSINWYEDPTLSSGLLFAAVLVVVDLLVKAGIVSLVGQGGLAPNNEATSRDIQP